MAEIELRALAHHYPGAPAPALHPLQMTWKSGGTYALLGPSGCGKSTMLNIVSGLLQPSHGQVLFDGRDVTGLPPAGRNIAQVFQVPVLYRSMSVGQNLGFPLVCRGWTGRRLQDRVGAVAESLGLSALLDRPAHALGADQKQLISLGRGLVREDVAAILLDEPLTVIDPQQKFALRRILRGVNADFGVTMVLVTHDQTEAMTFASEVIVMDQGRIVQRGSPKALFECPEDVFVGRFIGSPGMNLLAARPAEGGVVIAGTGLCLSFEGFSAATAGGATGGGEEGEWQIGIRPEHLEEARDGGDVLLEARLTGQWCEGSEEVLLLDHPAGPLRLRRAAGAPRPTGSLIALRARPGGIHLYHKGRRVAGGAGAPRPGPEGGQPWNAA